jgi:hypothetical protein
MNHYLAVNAAGYVEAIFIDEEVAREQLDLLLCDCLYLISIPLDIESVRSYAEANSELWILKN